LLQLNLLIAVKHVSDLLDWEDVEREDDWSVAWIDGRVIDKAWYRELRPMQRVNHFPGIEYLAKKKSLGRLLNAMKDKFPQDFTFYPKTWLLPEEYTVCQIHQLFRTMSDVILFAALGNCENTPVRSGTEHLFVNRMRRVRAKASFSLATSTTSTSD
jgi:hypothetical protein